MEGSTIWHSTLSTENTVQDKKPSTCCLVRFKAIVYHGNSDYCSVGVSVSSSIIGSDVTYFNNDWGVLWKGMLSQ